MRNRDYHIDAYNVVRMKIGIKYSHHLKYMSRVYKQMKIKILL